jgi:hypothetical protein
MQQAIAREQMVDNTSIMYCVYSQPMMGFHLSGDATGRSQQVLLEVHTRPSRLHTHPSNAEAMQTPTGTGTLPSDQMTERRQ